MSYVMQFGPKYRKPATATSVEEAFREAFWEVGQIDPEVDLEQDDWVQILDDKGRVLAKKRLVDLRA